MKEKLIDLFQYTHHFNKEMIGVIRDNFQKVDDNTIILINHTLNSHQIWNSRILGEKTFVAWQMNDFEILENLNEENFRNSLKIIENFDLDVRFEYQNSEGLKFNNSVFEMLFHVINHATYHRGQINSQLKQKGIEPIIADYICYKR